MSKLENLTAYTVVEKKELKEVNGYGYILSHNKTKARVAVIEMMIRTKYLQSVSGHRQPTIQVCHISQNIRCFAVPENSR